MELTRTAPAATLRADWLAHARGHRFTAFGLAVALLALFWLLAMSLLRVALGEAETVLRLGLAVAMALRAFLIAAATGLMEPLGALLGAGVTSGIALAYPIGLGLAAGAMIFVVSHEVIPETHRNGHQTPATLGLMGGFALMMVLDTTLG